MGGPNRDADGAVWVFERLSAGKWREQAEWLRGAGGDGIQWQGFAVGVSADGTTLAAGGWGDSKKKGAVWVFTRSSDGRWMQQGDKLVGTGGVGSSGVGFSVALSADGATLAAGAPHDDGDIGAVWVFSRSSEGQWRQQGGKLVGSGVTGDKAQQGRDVALSADGGVLAVGGPADSIGATWVFTRSGDEWRQQGNKLVGSGVTGDAARQGWNVALSSDGATLAAGGLDDNGGVGATWIFTQSSGVWSQQGDKLVGTGGSDTQFQGRSVALSGDGSVLAVGGTDSVSSNAKSSAATWVFQRSAAGEWTQQGSVLAGTLFSHRFPYSTTVDHAVALSNSGTTLAVRYSPDFGKGTGAWVFEASGVPSGCHMQDMIQERDNMCPTHSVGVVFVWHTSCLSGIMQQHTVALGIGRGRLQERLAERRDYKLPMVWAGLNHFAPTA